MFKMSCISCRSLDICTAHRNVHNNNKPGLVQHDKSVSNRQVSEWRKAKEKTTVNQDYYKIVVKSLVTA